MKKEQLLNQLYDSLYPNQLDAKSLFNAMIQKNIVVDASSQWYQDTPIIAETLYVDRFSNSLESLTKRIPYFKSLGVNLIHLMPILKTRKEENDGGYAVVDFNDVDEKFGTLESLHAFIHACHKEHIHVMIDYVLNHVAKEHEWAIKALAGNLEYQNFFMMFEDHTIPQQFDLTVPLVIPERKQSNFTYEPQINQWIYTSFSDYQWDLNYKNPYVFHAMISQMIEFSKWGIDMLRLDAIPFMWKTLGTTCRNLPEVHVLMRMFRLVRDLTCPNLALLGEAIVEPHEIVKYFGTDDAPECDYMYNANLMVDIWHTIATKDTRLLQIDAMRFQLPKHATWLNYARCHDDIGWGFNEEAIRSFGQDPFLHKQFLISFYNGTFPTSFSKGIDYQKNEKTQDARTNGMLASLAGLEQAFDQKADSLIQVSIQRILWIHSLLLFYQGAPMLYAGDELGMINDATYLEHNLTKFDSRWIHRPYFDWNLHKTIENRYDVRYKIYESLKFLVNIKNTEPLLKPFVRQEIIQLKDLHSILLIKKTDSDETLIGIFNASDQFIHLHKNVFNEHLSSKDYVDIITGRLIRSDQHIITLTPYEYLYIK